MVGAWGGSFQGTGAALSFSCQVSLIFGICTQNSKVLPVFSPPAWRNEFVLACDLSCPLLLQLWLLPVLIPASSSALICAHSSSCPGVGLMGCG